jgi:hypothetical protein
VRSSYLFTTSPSCTFIDAADLVRVKKLSAFSPVIPHSKLFLRLLT